MIKHCFFEMSLNSLSTKEEKDGAVSCVNMMQRNTINEPDTFEKELTHLLITLSGFLFINLYSHLFEEAPQQGVQAEKWLRAVYLCHQRWHLPLARLSKRRRLESHICLKTNKTILSCCQCQGADILRSVRKWQRLLVCVNISGCADVHVCANVCE